MKKILTVVLVTLLLTSCWKKDVDDSNSGAILDTKKVEATTKKVEDTTKKVEDTTKKVEDTTKKVEDTTKKIEATTKKVEATTKKVEATTKKVEATTKKVEATTKKIEATTKKVTEEVSDEDVDAVLKDLLGTDIWEDGETEEGLLDILDKGEKKLKESGERIKNISTWE